MTTAPEQPRGSPSKNETAIKAVLELVPFVGGAIATIFGDHMERRRGRIQETAAAAVDRVGGDADRITDRLKSDERFADIFFDGLAAASRSSIEAKRVAIGHALGDAAMGEGELELDESQLLLKAMADLELPHLRALQRISRMEQTELMASLLQATPPPVLAALIRHGLVIQGAYDGLAIEGVTDFGNRLLEFVEGAGSIPPE